MDEFSLIERIKQTAYKQSSLIKGIGDDAAVFRMNNEDIVTAMDTFVEGVHFTKNTVTYEQIGYRLLAANVSDLAAMGATPRYYLVSIVIPYGSNQTDIENIFTGMHELANTFNIDLIGGDTVSGEKLTLTITVIGSVPREKARYRSDAQDGDIVFVTGTLGDARAGLEILLYDREVAIKQPLIEKHQRPTPRVSFAKKLQRLKRLALNDISDGVANELHEIAENSQVTIYIDDARIPISPALQQFSEDEIFAWKYFGGEDFELVGTVAKSHFSFVKEVGASLGVKVTEIGYVSYNSKRIGEVFVKINHRLKRLNKHGYVHKS